MITDFFISLFNSIIDILPSIGFDWGVYSLEPLFNALESVNYYVPVGETFFILNTLIIGFYVYRLGYRIVVFILERFVI